VVSLAIFVVMLMIGVIFVEAFALVNTETVATVNISLDSDDASSLRFDVNLEPL
jgi:hypothetical protein